MQKFTQKYALIQLFEDTPEGADFSSDHWPLHSTIADTFAIDLDVSTIIDKLSELLGKHGSVTTIATEKKYFGPEKQTQVILLDMNKDLIGLHYDVVALLEQGGAEFNDPQFTKAGFIAHSTVQPHAQLYEGDVVLFNALSIIDMFPNEDPYQRKILKTITIGAKEL
jgi:hypothetical protein